jgi:hypothetical protein
VQPLATMVECVIPRVSPASARVVKALVATRGVVGRAPVFARSTGFRNRDQLRRVLAADGLPCLEDVASWIRMLGWVVDAETQGIALSRGALHSGKDPRSWYGTVRRLTGRPWGEVRALGSAWVLLQMYEAWNGPVTDSFAQGVGIRTIGMAPANATMHAGPSRAGS